MKKLIIIFFIFIYADCNINAQCFFNKIYDTYLGALNFGISIIQASDGGYIAVGVSNITSSTDGTYILKVNVCGDTLWQKIYEFSSGSGGDEGVSIIKLKDSSMSVCGWYFDTIEQARNTFLLNIDQLGDINWFKPINAGYNDLAVIHKQTTDGGFIIGGYYNVLNGKVFLVKTDSSGNIQWQQQYAVDTLENFLQSIDITADGGFIIGGYYRNSTTLKNHLFLIKTDSAGNEKWEKNYGSPNSQEYRGYVISTLDKGFAQVGYRRNPDQTSFRYIIKTDSSGTVKWEKLFGWPLNNDVFKIIRQLPDSSYIVAGSFKDTIHLNTRPRILLMKLNKHGDSIWTKVHTYYGGSYQFGSVTFDSVEDLQLTSDGGFILCGYIINNLMPGKNDLLLIKTDSLGNTCTIDTTTYAGCFYQECNYTKAAFTVSSDTIDLQYTDTIHFYNHSTFSQHWFWTFADNHTDTIQNPLHVFDTTGIYNVMLVASLNGCSDTTYKTVVVKNSVGIKSNLTQNSKFLFYPNPIKETLTISTTENQLATIYLLNLQGSQLLQTELQNKTATINIKNLATGIYIVKMATEKEVIFKKIVKE